MLVRINRHIARRMDVHQDENTKTVTATFDLPGMRKDDVAINVHNNVLNVSGEMKETTERKEEGYTHRERRYGKFSRSLTLPQGTKVGCSFNHYP